jgi:DNA-binding NarL/FixJ family response regulator
VNGATLLLVDDHAAFRAHARVLLEAAGFVVVGEAANGEEALEAVSQLRPDIVLLDVVLPDLDGFAVCERLAGSEPGPTVVLTSSRIESSYRHRLRQSAACGFLPKSQLTGAALAALVGSSP